MLDEESVPTFISPGFEVVGHRFIKGIKALEITYAGASDFAGEVRISVSQFRNPVNQRYKSGFSLVTMDAAGNLIDKSETDLPLSAQMTEINQDSNREMSMLGDAKGENSGRIGTYQQISVYINSQIPFEPNCYWTFEFPAVLKLDDKLSTIIGEGLFAPSGAQLGEQGFVLDFTVDIFNNIVTVNACKNSDSLIDKPYGKIVFSLVKLPDYLIPITPLKIRAFNDKDQTQLLLAEDKNDNDAYNELVPGFMKLDSFEANNEFANANDVTYTILFTPSHTSTPTTRINIDMP